MMTISFATVAGTIRQRSAPTASAMLLRITNALRDSVASAKGSKGATALLLVHQITLALARSVRDLSCPLAFPKNLIGSADACIRP
jgi:hypothetical protein